MRQRAFELAERLGMTVGELTKRMTMRELKDWYLYDQMRYTDMEVQTALILSKIDQAAGDKKATPHRYLRKLVEKRKPEDELKNTVAYQCMMRDIALASSGIKPKG